MSRTPRILALTAAAALVAALPVIASAQAARVAGLGLNAGHDLNRHNLGDFLRAVTGVQEVSIGHALIADALELGYDATVRAYLSVMAAAYPGPSA